MRISAIAIAAVAAALASTTAASAQDNTGKKLEASLDGDSEVGSIAPGNTTVGDPDGSGTASIRVNPGQRQVCYSITVVDIRLPATVAHIHPGAAGASNPPTINLRAPDSTGNSQGCVTVTREQALALIADPAGFYVNVHNSEFRAGAIRGQLGD